MEESKVNRWLRLAFLAGACMVIALSAWETRRESIALDARMEELRVRQRQIEDEGKLIRRLEEELRETRRQLKEAEDRLLRNNKEKDRW